jgi:putative ABC transport system permease protein
MAMANLGILNSATINSAPFEWNTYFKDINSFLIRQISSKIKTNYLTITIVCLLLSATICVVSVGMGIVLSLNDNAEEETPYDFLVIQELDDENLTKNETIQEYFSKNKLNLDEYLEDQFEIHVYEDKNFTYKDIINNTDKLWSVDKELSNESVRIISNSDYNKILKSQNKKSIELPENTYLLNCNYKGTKEHLESFIKKNIEINILDTKLKPAKKTLVENVLHLNLIGRNDPGSIIVPDNIIKNSNTEKMIILNGKCSNKDIEKFDNLLLDFMNPKSPYTVMTKTLIVTAYFGTTAITAFICCYIGIIFLIICVAILSLQQLTETFDNIYRYSILQKIGVEKRVCNHTIFKQIAIYFVTPVALASIYSAIVLPKIISKINDSLGLNIGANLKLTIILFLIIYGGYFLVTYFSCKNMITERVINNE